MKQEHGTTEMQIKIALLVVIIAVVGLCYFNPGKNYWESIGPQWDKMLNPVNHNK